MANTSSRTLRLLSLLQTHRYWPGSELAARLEVSPRTLRRDVDRLRELGYPVDAQRGVEGGYQLAAGAALPPLVLDDEEAVALTIGLMSAAQSSVAGMAEASVQVLAKVVQVMPKRLRRRVDAVQAMTEQLTSLTPNAGQAAVDATTLTVVAQACRDTERLEFGYTSGDGRPSERRTEPHRLVSVGRRWYLVAYDLDRHDWRSFRLDRLRQPQSTGVRFSPRRLPADDAAEFVRAGLREKSSAHTITAVVHAPAAAVEARIGQWAIVEARTARTCSVRIQADSFEWAVMALGVTDTEFRVAGPPEFVAQLATWSGRMARASAPS
jgi:predicted DNA-binding transcriptional regulator YafY